MALLPSDGDFATTLVPQHHNEEKMDRAKKKKKSVSRRVNCAINPKRVGVFTASIINQIA